MGIMKDIKFDKNPTVNQSTTIHYYGFLKDSPELTIVYGFSQSWEHTTELKMKKDTDGFTAELNILNFDSFHFCFRDSNHVWDNNSGCNYIVDILPSTQKAEETFNIDALIEELLEPIVLKSQNIETDVTPVQIEAQPIDLGVEITKILSEINDKTTCQELVEFSSLDEILSGTIIDETPIELFEETSAQTEELSLVKTKNSFVVSARQLSKFYLFRKRLKLAFYKALVKIPKLIFGAEEQ